MAYIHIQLEVVLQLCNYAFRHININSCLVHIFLLNVQQCFPSTVSISTETILVVFFFLRRRATESYLAATVSANSIQVIVFPIKCLYNIL